MEIGGYHNFGKMDAVQKLKYWHDEVMESRILKNGICGEWKL